MDNLQTAKRIAIILGVIIFALVLMASGGVFLLESLFGGWCGNRVFQEFYSPDKEYKAVIFERNCGATTSFSTQVSVLPAAAQLPNEGGNILAMDGHPDWTAVTIRWETNRRVSITHAGQYKVLSKQNAIRIFLTTIEIVFQTGALPATPFAIHPAESLRRAAHFAPTA